MGACSSLLSCNDCCAVRLDSETGERKLEERKHDEKGNNSNSNTNSTSQLNSNKQKEKYSNDRNIEASKEVRKIDFLDIQSEDEKNPSINIASSKNLNSPPTENSKAIGNIRVSLGQRSSIEEDSEVDIFNRMKSKALRNLETNIKKISDENNKHKVNKNKYIKKFTSQKLLEVESKLEIFEKEKCQEFGIKISDLNKLEACDEDPSENIVYNDGYVIDGYLYYGTVIESSSQKKGYGIQLFSNGRKYEGYWDKDKYNLYGRVIDEKGVVFEGNFIDGKLTGKGIESFFIDEDKRYYYKGDFLQDNKHGKGEIETKTYSYEGQFENNFKSGEGKFISKVKENKFTYEGNFDNDNFNGRGVLTYLNGEYYDGEFKNGEFHGTGKYTYPLTNEVYEGNFENGKRNGHGKLTRNGRLIYEGNYKDNLPHGRGSVVRNGLVVEGEYENGVFKDFNARS